MKRIPLIVGVIVLLLSLPVAVFLTTSTQTSFPTRASTTGASLSLVPTSGQIPKTGRQISILLTTGATTVDGADIILTYDANQLAVSRNTLTPGIIFNNQNNKVVTNKTEVDPKTKIGTIHFSAIFLTPIEINTKLASFTLVPLTTGTKTTISFQNTSGAFEHNTTKNILVKSTLGEYSI